MTINPLKASHISEYLQPGEHLKNVECARSKIKVKNIKIVADDGELGTGLNSVFVQILQQ